ncbi:hypothetical protein ATO1_18190 [Phaeobacter sp. 22II1-1F12B]|nr:hypothetical protein ATO1_18190 [Phaeobacter sp. 22II1-1F12B]
MKGDVLSALWDRLFFFLAPVSRAEIAQDEEGYHSSIQCALRKVEDFFIMVRFFGIILFQQISRAQNTVGF